jgi:hypothetical protein
MVRSGHRRIIESNGNADRPRQDLDGAPSGHCAGCMGSNGYRSTDKNGEWLTMRDAAAQLGVSHHQIRKLIKGGVLGTPEGRRWCRPLTCALCFLMRPSSSTS